LRDPANREERHLPLTQEVTSPGTDSSPRPGALFLAFLRLGATAFGGPAMVAYIGQAATRRGWLSREEYAEGVALCQSIPGATAMQSAAFVGLRTSGVWGAFAAYAGFGLPAAVLMLAASTAYGHVAGLGLVQAGFRGFRAMIVALVVNAAFEFSRKSILSVQDVVLALGCAGALYVGANPVAVIAVAVGLGVVLRRRAQPTATVAPRSWPAGTSRAAAWIAVAALAVAVALLALVPRLGVLALVCMKVDALAFGGGFASLPLMFHEMVEVRPWIEAKTFMDGIALGQVTPGPIVVTATFVGYRVAGLAGSLIATVAVFLPSFVLVVAAAPWFSRLRARVWFAPALHGAMLSFVGLLVFVAVHLGQAIQWTIGTGALAVLAFVALRAGVEVLWVVLVSGVVAVILL
jgi:chromate transporter